jgi:hypothetical protein
VGAGRPRGLVKCWVSLQVALSLGDAVVLMGIGGQDMAGEVETSVGGWSWPAAWSES